MAEATLAIVPLFSNALDWFRMIRVARSAESDMETCQLRLDIAGLRLSRWGKSANLNRAKDSPSTIPIAEQERRLCEKTLAQIDKLFRNAQGSAHGMTTTTSDQDTFELNEGLKKLYIDHTNKKFAQRITSRAKWAMYKGEDFMTSNDLETRSL